jgi:hypothetical protein
MPLSIQPEKTIAVLIGSSNFPEDTENLPDLPGVINNIESLTRIFTNENLVGIPENNILTLLDERDSGAIATKVARKARSATDTLVVYYAGHGLIGERSLFLATPASHSQDFEFNSIAIGSIKNAILASPARKKIFILDCCFSGRALNVMAQPSDLVRSSIDIKGTFAISASPENEPALAPSGEKYTTFTGELIKVLEDGIENGKEGVTIQEIFQAIYDEFNRRGLPLPQKVSSQNADRIVLVRNRTFGESVEEKIERINRNLMDRLNSQEKRIEEIAKSISEIRDRNAEKFEKAFKKHLLKDPKLFEQSIRLLLTDTRKSKDIWKVLSREFVSSEALAAEAVKWEEKLKKAESNLLEVREQLLAQNKKSVAARAKEVLKLLSS